MEGNRSLKSTKKRSLQQPSGHLPVRTSAQIIAEARQSVRALPTGRPFTPADVDKQSRGRPPSVYSIGARHFSDEQTSRPNTGHKAPPSRAGSSHKLPPIEKSLPPPQPAANTKHAKPTPPTPMHSTANLLEDDTVPESCDTGPTTLRSRDAGPTSSPTTVSKQTTKDSHKGLGIVPPQGPGVTPAQGPGVTPSQGPGVTPPQGPGVTPPQDPGVTPPQGSRKLSHSQASTHLKRDSTSSKAEEIDTYWEAKVAPLLRSMDESTADVAQLCEVSGTLWRHLEGRGLLGRVGGDGGTKRRAAVLRSLFRLLDHTDSRLLLRLARIILAMKVTGKNLLNTCKLLFNISRTEANDMLFSEEQVLHPLIELLRDTDPLADMDAMVYGMGTLKMLSGNSGLRDQLVGAGMSALLAGVLQRCTEPSLDETNKLHCANLLVQLTIALRNLSESPSCRLEAVKDGIVSRLCPVLGTYLQDKDIIFNISRVLSKLTLSKDCEEAVQHCPTLLPLLLQALACHADNAEIAVRICFILGNLSANDNHDPTRELLYFTHKAIPLLNDLCTKYLSVEKKQLKKVADKQPGKGEDVLIKLVRVMANLTVHPRVGPSIANDGDTLRNLLMILGTVSPIAYEELVLNVLATLNNISFYAQPDSSLVELQEDVATLLLQVVLQDTGDCLLECVRVYGNLSRHPDVRKLLQERKVDEIMVTLLDSGRMELVYASCGVLINMMVDVPQRATLARMGGVKKLVDVLRDLACEDWQLASLVCKTLWNFSENLTEDVSSYLGAEEAEELIHLLQIYTENHPGCEDANSHWQTEFIPVAKLLLHRIQLAHTLQH